MFLFACVENVVDMPYSTLARVLGSKSHCIDVICYHISLDEASFGIECRLLDM